MACGLQGDPCGSHHGLRGRSSRLHSFPQHRLPICAPCFVLYILLPPSVLYILVPSSVSVLLGEPARFQADVAGTLADLGAKCGQASSADLTAYDYETFYLEQLITTQRLQGFFTACTAAAGGQVLKMCRMPQRLRLDTPWPTVKAGLRATPAAVTFSPELQLYAVLVTRQVADSHCLAHLCCMCSVALCLDMCICVSPMYCLPRLRKKTSSLTLALCDECAWCCRWSTSPGWKRTQEGIVTLWHRMPMLWRRLLPRPQGHHPLQRCSPCPASHSCSRAQFSHAMTVLLNALAFPSFPFRCAHSAAVFTSPCSQNIS